MIFRLMHIFLVSPSSILAANVFSTLSTFTFSRFTFTIGIKNSLFLRRKSLYTIRFNNSLLIYWCKKKLHLFVGEKKPYIFLLHIHNSLYFIIYFTFLVSWTRSINYNLTLLCFLNFKLSFHFSFIFFFHLLVFLSYFVPDLELISFISNFIVLCICMLKFILCQYFVQYRTF